MRRVPSGVALLAILGGLAALAVPASDSAFAAKGCNGMSPVCANGASGPQTYDNACAAKAAGARVEHPGACNPLFCVGFTSTLASHPMCGMDPLSHARMTYPNNCAAEQSHAIWLYDGPCRGKH